MPRGIEYGPSGPAVRITGKEDAPQIRAAKGGVVYGTNFVYDERGPIAPITGTRETFRPEQTNWGRVMQIISENPTMDIEAAKRASVMSTNK